MPAPTGQAIPPAVDLRVHLDSPSIPLKWVIDETSTLWQFLNKHHTLVVTAFDDTTITFNVPSYRIRLTIPLADFHSGYFVQE